MWTTLNSCKHLKFYQDFDRQSQNLFAGPMQRAVEYLQTLPEAKDLFAFTSHAHFQVTTSPSIADDEDHFFLCGVDLRFRTFRISDLYEATF